jgi:hypothetical protein
VFAYDAYQWRGACKDALAIGAPQLANQAWNTTGR